MPETEIGALGLIGDDESGKYALDTMADAGLDVSLVKKCESATSFTYVMNDKITRERTFFHHRGANAKFSEDSFSWDDKRPGTKILLSKVPQFSFFFLKKTNEA